MVVCTQARKFTYNDVAELKGTSGRRDEGEMVENNSAQPSSVSTRNAVSISNGYKIVIRLRSGDRQRA